MKHELDGQNPNNKIAPARAEDEAVTNFLEWEKNEFLTYEQSASHWPATKKARFEDNIPMGMLEDASYEEQCAAQGYYPE